MATSSRACWWWSATPAAPARASRSAPPRVRACGQARVGTAHTTAACVHLTPLPLTHTAGKVRQDVGVDDIGGVDDVPLSVKHAPEDADRSLIFRYLDEVRGGVPCCVRFHLRPAPLHNSTLLPPARRRRAVRRAACCCLCPSANATPLWTRCVACARAAVALQLLCTSQFHHHHHSRTNPNAAARTAGPQVRGAAPRWHPVVAGGARAPRCRLP